MNMQIKRLSDRQEPMLIKNKNQVAMAAFTAYEEIPWLCHGFSTRLGGVSEGIYSSMNFKEDGEDPVLNVRKNYRIAAGYFGCDPEKMIRPSLVHGKTVRQVVKADYGNGIVRESSILNTDGLITDHPGVTLVTTYADCVPLYFVDVKHRAIGLSHSGWRGTVLKIGRETLRAMEEAYHTRPEDVIACIGPCICKDCYEVGEEVFREFQEAYPEDMDILQAKENGKYDLDLRRANEAQLLEAGIRKEHLHVSDLCTSCNSSLFFSHRATAGKRGALAAFLGIREQ